MVVNSEVSVINLRDVLKEIIKQCEIAKKLSNPNVLIQQIVFIEYLAVKEIKRLNEYQEIFREKLEKEIMDSDLNERIKEMTERD